MPFLPLCSTIQNMKRQIIPIILIILLLPLYALAESYEDLTSAIESKYGITILIGDSCLGCEEGGLAFNTQSSGTSAYLSTLGPINYEPAIRKINDCLSEYPPDFIRNITCPGGEKGLRILLIGGISRIAPSPPRPEILLGRTYLKDGYINVVLAADALTDETIHHELWHAIEYRIKAEDPEAFTAWKALNPPGFRYDPKNDQSEYRDDWFISIKGMSYPGEDRATIWAAIYTQSAEWWNQRPHLKQKRNELFRIAKAVFPEYQTPKEG